MARQRCVCTCRHRRSRPGTLAAGAHALIIIARFPRERSFVRGSSVLAGRWPLSVNDTDFSSFRVSRMSYVFPPASQPSVEIKGRTERFPVNRIYCVGRNYAAHAREMGKDPDREPPFFFTKPADAIVPNNATIPYPSRTSEPASRDRTRRRDRQGRQNIPSAVRRSNMSSATRSATI